MTDPTDARAVADDPSGIVQQMPEGGDEALAEIVKRLRGQSPIPSRDEVADAIVKAEADLRAEVERLKYALAQAAVPLEGMTLAAHMTESDMGLCKGTWNEINNAVAHIRATLSPETDGGQDGA